MEKVCTRCNKVLGISMYNEKKDNVGEYTKMCKICLKYVSDLRKQDKYKELSRKQSVKYRAKYPEKVKEQDYGYTFRRKDKFLQQGREEATKLFVTAMQKYLSPEIVAKIQNEIGG